MEEIAKSKEREVRIRLSQSRYEEFRKIALQKGLKVNSCLRMFAFAKLDDEKQENPSK